MRRSSFRGLLRVAAAGQSGEACIGSLGPATASERQTEEPQQPAALDWGHAAGGAGRTGEVTFNLFWPEARVAAAGQSGEACIGSLGPATASERQTEEPQQPAALDWGHAAGGAGRTGEVTFNLFWPEARVAAAGQSGEACIGSLGPATASRAKGPI